MAKKYILMMGEPKIWYHEIISGQKALERGISISLKPINADSFPCKYEYPAHINTPSKRKQYRTGIRDRARKAFSKIANLKQYTITYHGFTYTTYAFSHEEAYRLLSQKIHITWRGFVKRVSLRPQGVKKGVRWIKSRNTTFTLINQFNKQHNASQINHPPIIGQVSRLAGLCFQIRKPKPKSLVF